MRNLVRVSYPAQRPNLSAILTAVAPRFERHTVKWTPEIGPNVKE